MIDPYSIVKKEAKRISLVKQVELIKWFTKYYGVRLKWSKNKKVGGTASFRTYKKDGKLEITINKHNKELLPVLFHELGHIHCAKNRIWPLYHYLKQSTSLTIKELRGHNRTALKAERWVDKWGAKEQLKWFPNLPYWLSYVGEEGRKWLNENYLGYFMVLLQLKNERQHTRTRNR